MPFPGRSLWLAPLVLVVAGLGETPSVGAGGSGAAKGLIADRCVGCHAVPGLGEDSLPTVDAPSFQTMADAPETYTEARLRAFLVKPHWPMKRFRLSPRDVENVLAFIESLRAE